MINPFFQFIFFTNIITNIITYKYYYLQILLLTNIITN
jgi:hypothetical protein